MVYFHRNTLFKAILANRPDFIGMMCQKFGLDNGKGFCLQSFHFLVITCFRENGFVYNYFAPMMMKPDGGFVGKQQKIVGHGDRDDGNAFFDGQFECAILERNHIREVFFLYKHTSFREETKIETIINSLFGHLQAFGTTPHAGPVHGDVHIPEEKPEEGDFSERAFSNEFGRIEQAKSRNVEEREVIATKDVLLI